MKLKGNILNIKSKRDSNNADIELEIDKIEYITYKKDGKYHQPFDYIDELETPLILTGDCLVRDNTKHTEEGDFEFKVYDKAEDGTYTLNENKRLELSIEVDFDEGLSILSALTYTVVISNDEFQKLKSDRAKERRAKKGSHRKDR